MKKSAIILTLLVTATLSFGANCYWKPVVGSDVFSTTANWSPAYTSSSDSLFIIADDVNYPTAVTTAKLTEGWGNSGATNDALYVGLNWEGSMEVACGTATAYFKSIIIGDAKRYADVPASYMTVSSGTIARYSGDTGYLTVGRNNVSGNVNYGEGYLNITNSGNVNMDRMTVGEQKSGTQPPGVGHVILQDNGSIYLPCEKTFSPTSYVGLRINSGDFTWIDNGTSTVTTGSLSLGIAGGDAKLIFQSSDNYFGVDGQGINIFENNLSADGMATFYPTGRIDVTGLADAADWVTIITAVNGFSFYDPSISLDNLLTKESIAEGWVCQIYGVSGAFALQVKQVARTADIDGNGKVNFIDFNLLANAWQTEIGDADWNVKCDISVPGDNKIDNLDLAVFAEAWLNGFTE
jgi:hypothetical protein